MTLTRCWRARGSPTEPVQKVIPIVTQPPVVTFKKLIEVSLPLDDINAASAREKSIRHGHPSTLHLWWARRPLAAARAVLFAQLVDDPSAHPEEFPTEEAVETERKRLHALISQLVLWENTTNEAVLEQARAEIRRSWRRTCAANAHHPQAAELFNCLFVATRNSYAPCRFSQNCGSVPNLQPESIDAGLVTAGFRTPTAPDYQEYAGGKKSRYPCSSPCFTSSTDCPAFARLR